MTRIKQNLIPFAFGYRQWGQVLISLGRCGQRKIQFYWFDWFNWQLNWGRKLSEIYRANSKVTDFGSETRLEASNISTETRLPEAS